MSPDGVTAHTDVIGQRSHVVVFMWQHQSSWSADSCAATVRVLHCVCAAHVCVAVIAAEGGAAMALGGCMGRMTM